jgi:myo-inositol 2-dehydrogenase / D-chiro-inositol 1-dehydrogenase
VIAQLGCAAAQSMEDLLREDVHAVYIASLPKAHYEQALACASAGKHIFCGKPLGMTIAEKVLTACYESARTGRD